METPQKISSQYQLEALQRQMSLQKLQINRLLEITQAINDNMSIDNLFGLYKKTMSFEMRLKKFALYIRNGEEWICAASAGIESSLLELPIETYFDDYQRTGRVEMEKHPLLSNFTGVVPVYHKKYAIAYAFADMDWSDGDMHDINLIAAITNVIAVAIENKRLFKRQIEQERMKREMELAVQVQNMLIPNKLPNNSDYEFSGIYQPHKGVGGDYYDFMQTGPEEVAFCIADISGKGIAAALLMSNFQANLQSLIHRKYLSVKKFINRLNSLVLKTTQGEKFITFFIARYNSRKKRLRYICAGHNPPFMYTEGKLQRLEKGCTILGAFPRIPEIDFGEIYLKEDALFFLYTDGLTDLQNKEDVFFDDTHVAEFIKENATLPTDTFNEKLMEHVTAFKGERPFPDDISILTGRLMVSNHVPLKKKSLKEYKDGVKDNSF